MTPAQIYDMTLDLIRHGRIDKDKLATELIKRITGGNYAALEDVYREV